MLEVRGMGRMGGGGGGGGQCVCQSSVHLHPELQNISMKNELTLILMRRLGTCTEQLKTSIYQQTVELNQ